LRNTTGRAYWFVNFSGIHYLPTVLVYLGCVPLMSALANGSNPVGPLDAAALVVTLGGIWIEAASDRQLFDFVSNNNEPGSLLKEGWWARSRHPNYFGELSFWWGPCLFGIAADGISWWNISGAASITVLFVFITIPMIEKRHRAKREGYEEYVRETPVIIPRLFGTCRSEE